MAAPSSCPRHGKFMVAVSGEMGSGGGGGGGGSGEEAGALSFQAG